MPSARRVSPMLLVLVLSAALVQLAVSTRSRSLSTNNQRCFYSTSRCATPRSCRACLNDELSTPCFLDSQGLCLAVADSAPAEATNATQRFAAATTSYCAASDSVCSQCLQTTGNSACTGADSLCVCVAACESADWQQNVQQLVRSASVSTVASSDDSPVDSQTSAGSGGSSTSTGVVIVIIIAGVIIAVLAASAMRRRRKQAAPAYNLAATPTADLPAKTLTGRV